MLHSIMTCLPLLVTKNWLRREGTKSCVRKERGNARERRPQRLITSAIPDYRCPRNNEKVKTIDSFLMQKKNQFSHYSLINPEEEKTKVLLKLGYYSYAEIQRKPINDIFEQESHMIHPEPKMQGIDSNTMSFEHHSQMMHSESKISSMDPAPLNSKWKAVQSARL